jgi:hypothetical protein
MDKYKENYWNKIKVGSIIQLDDTQTLEFLLENGMPVSSNGADFEVVRVKDLSLNDDSVKMKLVYIQLDDILWYLVVHNVENEITLKIYYQPDDIDFGNRQDLLDSDCYYLWEEPEDVDNIVLTDLVFSTEIDEDGIIYKSLIGAMHGTSVEVGEKDNFATVVELSTETECEDKDFLIIEVCNVEVEEQLEDGYLVGGPIVNIDTSNSFVMFLRGCSVQMNDVEVLT